MDWPVEGLPRDEKCERVSGTWKGANLAYVHTCVCGAGTWTGRRESAGPGPGRGRVNQSQTAPPHTQQASPDFSLVSVLAQAASQAAAQGAPQ